MKQWNGTYKQALELASSVWDRVYNMIPADDIGWFRVMSSPDHTLGWIDPTGSAHILTLTGYKVAMKYSEISGKG